jgi:hypothetical protein
MRRVLFATIVLVMLLGSFSSAFAAEPVRVEQATPAVLGEVWWFYFPFPIPPSSPLPGVRVDAYLYRPSTMGGWPWPGPDWGTWWWTGPDSEQRRQSWPAWQYTDIWGYYYAEFLFPRDEAWFPCGFPLKWQCNFVVDQFGTMEWHSPYMNVYECRATANPFVDECLIWPWAVDPQDTVSPMEVYLIDEFGGGYIIPFEVLGMFWKWEDLE